MRNSKREHKTLVRAYPYFLRTNERARRTAHDKLTNDELDFEFQDRCIIRISLVEGFGELYPAKVIKECPDWLEVHVIADFVAMLD